MPGSLVGITYSEFDNHVGPQLKYSYPTDALSKEQFEAFSDYVIVSKQLCEKSIIVVIDDLKFLNYSVAIDNPKYFRNTLIFSFGFILTDNVDSEPYEAALKKISLTFVNLEVETEYLFQIESKHRLQDFLKTLFNDLNASSEACIRLDALDNYLAVKLFRSPAFTVDIHDYDVPILNSNHNMDLSTLPWDISFQHLIPFIDGKSHVKKIVRAIDMDGDFVTRSLKLLLFHEYVILTDIFRFSNVYEFTSIERALSLLSNTTILNEMRDFCAIEICGIVATIPSNNQLINFMLKFQQNKTVQEIVLECIEKSNAPSKSSGSSNTSDRFRKSGTWPAVDTVSDSSNSQNNANDYMNPRLLPFKNMDISRAIAYACSKHILRRVHEYPVYAAVDNTAPLLASTPLPSAVEDSVYNNTLQNSKSSVFLAGSAASTLRDPVPSTSSNNRRLSFGDTTRSARGVEEQKEHRSSLIVRDDNHQDPGVSRVHSSSMSATDDNKSGLGTTTSKPVLISNSKPVRPAIHITATTGPGDNGSYVVGSEIMHKSTSPSQSDISNTPDSTTFQKLTRTRSVVGHKYLNPASVGGTSSSHQAIPHVPRSITQTRAKTLTDVITSLSGSCHMDELCCKYNVNYNDIVKFPGVSLIYK